MNHSQSLILPLMQMRWSRIFEAMRTITCQKDLLPTTTGSNRVLVDVFSGAIATPEQAHDLSFRKVGLQDFENFVKHRILKQPSSAAAPVRRRRLLTMAPRKMGKKRVSQKELEHKQVIKCLRRRLAWCNETGQSYNPAQEQYSVYPWALADCDRNPHGGVKSTWTDKLRGVTRVEILSWRVFPTAGALVWL